MPSPGLLLLQRVGLFAALSEDDLEALATTLRLRRYGRDEVICHRDDPGDSLFIIEDGSVKIGLTSPDAREVILTQMNKGDFFGEMALLDGQPRSADVTALEACRLLSLPREAFLSFLESHPAASTALLAALSKRVRRLTDQVFDAAVLDLQTRLARSLLKLTEDSVGETDRVLHMTQSQLGAVVGATRESVNKWLGFYERRGLIKRDKRAITILQPNELEQHASLDAYAW